MGCISGKSSQRQEEGKQIQSCGQNEATPDTIQDGTQKFKFSQNILNNPKYGTTNASQPNITNNNKNMQQIDNQAEQENHLKKNPITSTISINLFDGERELGPAKIFEEDFYFTQIKDEIDRQVPVSSIKGIDQDSQSPCLNFKSMQQMGLFGSQEISKLSNNIKNFNQEQMQAIQEDSFNSQYLSQIENEFEIRAPYDQIADNKLKMYENKIQKQQK